ncbi:hypothetical protein [Rhodococcus sp. 077-4]
MGITQHGDNPCARARPEPMACGPQFASAAYRTYQLAESDRGRHRRGPLG